MVCIRTIVNFSALGPKDTNGILISLFFLDAETKSIKYHLFSEGNRTLY